jgi:alpha-beta hydrolase superfamily lysophospholipase
MRLSNVILVVSAVLASSSSFHGDGVSASTMPPSEESLGILEEVSSILSDLTDKVVGSSDQPSTRSVSDLLAPVTSGFVTNDGERIAFRRWNPVVEPRAVVYIVHGMAEHSGRYDPFARELVSSLDVRVIALDQRGHGLTSTHGGTMADELGKFRKGDKVPNPNAITIMGHDVCDLIIASHDNLPVILFGHSMGSVVARTALIVANDQVSQIVKGLILSGVPSAPHWLEMYPLHALAAFVKSTGLGHALVQRSFTKFKFDDPVKRKTKDMTLPENCFVSSDPEECELFNSDPYTNHLVDPEILFSIVITLADLENAIYFGSPEIDVLFITGRDDAVAKFGEAARADADRMIRAGHQVTEIYYSGARHEVLRERATVRRESTAQMIAWIRTKLDL